MVIYLHWTNSVTKGCITLPKPDPDIYAIKH